MAAAEERLEPNVLDGVPAPRERAGLVGHAAAETALLDAYRHGRLHHAWLLVGPRGIGKATLAFRFAKFLAAHPDPQAAAVQEAADLFVDPNHPQARRVAAASHPEILHLRRPWDEQAKRFRSELPVDEVRRTVRFFGTSAAAGGWRVAVLDAADDMNASSANALLKILEEPPPRSVFLVLAHSPGAAMPTIRSRCRRLALSPLGAREIEAVLAEIAPQAGAAERRQAAGAADGSVRRALLLLHGDGLAIRRQFEQLAAKLPRAPVGELYVLADAVSARGRDEAWDAFQEAALDWLRGAMRGALGDLSRAARFAEADQRLRELFGVTDIYNLDRKSAVLAAMRALAEAVSDPISPAGRAAGAERASFGR